MAQTGPSNFLPGVREAMHLIVSGNPVIVATTERTVHLAVVATGIAAVIGVPCGCALGIGRFPGARILLALASAVTRVPPVVIGVVVLLLVTGSTPWGNAPLAGVGWLAGSPTNPHAYSYFAQTLLAIPIVVALTASAVRKVPAILLEQARAYGAPGWKCAVFVLREARRSVVAAVLVAMGVTITAIGALIVSNSAVPTSQGAPQTLALGAFYAIRQVQPGVEQQTAALTIPTQSLAVAYTIVLLAAFVVIAVALTWLQRKRVSWIPGQLS